MWNSDGVDNKASDVGRTGGSCHVANGSAMLFNLSYLLMFIICLSG